MIIPILRKEVLGSGRHGRYFAVRGTYLVLLACLTIPVLVRQADRMLNSPSFQASRMGRDFTIGFGLLQFFLVALIAPALSIGVIAAERASGNLELLHVANVRPSQLVIGKWFARMGWLMLFLLSGLPLLVAGTLMGGVGAELVAYVFVWSAVAGALGTSLGFTLSGGMRQTVPALVLAYMFLLSLYVGGPIMMVFADKALGTLYRVREEDLGWICPPFAFEAFSRGQIPRIRAWSMMVPHAVLAALVILPAPLFARPEGDASRRIARPKAGTAAAARRSSIAGNPIAWRDGRAARHSLTSKLLRWAYLALGGVVITGSIAASLMTDRYDPDFGRIAIFLLLMTGCAVALIAGSGSIAEERERRCMPLLALSRLTAGDILGGKLWGLLLYLWPMVVLPLVVSVLFFAGRDPVAIPVVMLLTGSLLGAACSFGMLTSSFSARPATAAGIAIAAALVYVIVPPVMMDLLDVRGDDILIIFNPLVGTLELLEELGRRSYYGEADYNRFGREDFTFGMVGIAFHALVGACCLLLTWSTLSTREEA